MDSDPTRFISGVYNYCDRWCERCRLNDRCILHFQEQETRFRHIMQGENPDDPEVFMADLQESFSQTFDLLEEMANEHGIDLNDLPEEERSDLDDLSEEHGIDLDDLPEEPEFRIDYTEHPLCQRSARWCDRVGDLLERIRTEMPGIGEQLAIQLLKQPPQEAVEEGHETIETIKAVRDAYEVLLQYRFLLTVKLARALRSWSLAEQHAPPRAEFDREDAWGTAKLLDECLGHAAASLWHISEFNRGWQDLSLPLVMETEALRHALNERFPGYQSFRRPGFDD